MMASHRIYSQTGIQMRLLLAGWMLTFGVLTLTGCVSPVTTETVTPSFEVVESSDRFRKEFLLSPGDQIEVTVLRNEEASRSVVIRPDGYISLPLIGDMEAAGRTVPELREQLTAAFGKRLVDPEVVLIPEIVREPRVFVFGEVGRPGPVPYRQARTAAEAVAEAGGMNVAAAQKRVSIIRLSEEGKLQAIQIDAPPGQPGSYMALQAMPLMPDDLIVVPESDQSQADRLIATYVTGPATAVNAVLSPYLQFRLIRVIEED